MRLTLALAAVLYSTAVMAQGAAPGGIAPEATVAQATTAEAPPPSSQGNQQPTIGGKKLVQVKPHGGGAKLSIAARVQACLDIDDGTKGRLDCYDAVFAPKPNPKAKPAERVADCRLTKEEDERLTCYNGFAEKIPKF